MLEDNPTRTIFEDEELRESCLLIFLAETKHYLGDHLNLNQFESFLDQDSKVALKELKIPRKKWRRELWSRIKSTSMTDSQQDNAKQIGPEAFLGFILGGTESLSELVNQLVLDVCDGSDLGLVADLLDQLQIANEKTKDIAKAHELKDSDLLHEHYYKGRKRYRNGGHLPLRCLRKCRYVLLNYEHSAFPIRARRLAIQLKCTSKEKKYPWQKQN